jgi:hypothetical protein
MCLAGTALLVLALPAFWRYDAGEPPPPGTV